MTSTPQSDATPTYRGYRLQALYALSRILEENREFHFQPEGKEDLAIFDQNHQLLERAATDHLDRSSNSVSQFLQSALDSINEMERLYSELPPEEAPANLTTVMQGLIELRATLLPQHVTEDGMLLKKEDIVDWTEALEEARNVIFALYLLWVADVLDEAEKHV